MQKEVNNCIATLKRGGTILYPTDTIWGIGCDATNHDAVNKIYSLKERDLSKSMLILVSDIRMAEQYLEDLPEIAMQLFEASDSPMTLILDGAVNLADNLSAADGSIGLRIPDDPFCQLLLQNFRKPIVSTSANLSGQPSPGGFTDIDEIIKRKVDYIVNWRQDEPGANAPSSVIRIKSSGEIKILRP